MILCSEFFIHREADVALARYRAGEAATLLGLDDRRRAEVRLIATELAHNHLDHQTCCGSVCITGVRMSGVPVLSVVSLDDGPGIGRICEVLQTGADGFRSATGLGAGLGSVARMADRFFCCSDRDPSSGCPCSWSDSRQGTAVIAQCWSGERKPLFAAIPGMDLAALVCPRVETLPCGDGVFVDADSRFVRIVLVDSPGKGRGGGQTQLIGSMLEGLDLIWPPDHVLESLSVVLFAEPATSLCVVRLDRLLGEVRCCRIGSVFVQLLIDSQTHLPPVLQNPEPGSLVGLADSVYVVRKHVCCLLHSDGLSGPGSRQCSGMLRTLQDWYKAWSRCPPLAELVVHSLQRRYRQSLDDAALCFFRWQRS
jgi:anti-sigma regulatory factor (Ser/Thr protein kinase)